MNPQRRELAIFATVLACLVAAFLAPALAPGRVLSPADVIYSQPGFTELKPSGFIPANRQLIDPFLQFEPWLEFTRGELRQGRWPLWNPYVGLGAPHLANGQSAVFDPFHLIAYLGELPSAQALMAAVRLWTAGLGMFVLASSWGLSRRGRWFAGLVYPFCGFLVVWLQYPLASSALWLPWMFWASDRVLQQSNPQTTLTLSLITAASLFGGNVQATAHNLMAIGLYVVWRSTRWAVTFHTCPRSLVPWTLALILGLCLSAVQILPLFAYLAKSPVWADREREHALGGVSGHPRLLDSVTTAFPLIYGSQRRGQPNLGKALGVQNLNESAGAFAGLATLIWLAPMAWLSRRQNSRVRFLAALGIGAALVAFSIPPFVQVLHFIPVVRVIDHRRLAHLSAFALVLLGAHAFELSTGVPELRVARRSRRFCFGLAALMAVGALAVPLVAPRLEARAFAHYRHLADPGDAIARAQRQIDDLRRFLPGYLAFEAYQLGMLGWLAVRHASRRSGPAVPTCAIPFVMVDLFIFGLGQNPSVALADYQPSSSLIDYLATNAPPPTRILAIGEALPPNTLMRYGLADLRNYDSIELLNNLGPFEMLYEPDTERGTRSSRREVTWSGVLRCRALLEQCGVSLIVATSPPPLGIFRKVEVVSGCWIAHLDPYPSTLCHLSPSRIRIDATSDSGQAIFVPVSNDSGWRAEADSVPIPLMSNASSPFLTVQLPPGVSSVTLIYDPPEFRLGLALSTATALVSAAWLFGHQQTRLLTKANHRTRAWMPGLATDRIEFTNEIDLPRPSCTEGLYKDGPLHLRPVRQRSRRP